jgi:hypothetical protein
MIFKIKYSGFPTFSRKSERKKQDKMCKWMVRDLRRSICEPWMRLKITPTSSEIVRWDSAIGIATRYGLDGLGIESRWRRSFSHSSRPAPLTSPPLVQGVSGLFPGLNLQGSGVGITTHPHLVSRLKSGAMPVVSLWDFMACTLPLPLPLP